jgi:RNA polymerase sigma factor (sigma-70 family)
MHNEENKDLLVIITMQGNEPEAAQKAFDEFYRRFKVYVWKVAVSLARHIHDPNQEEVAYDIFNDTFLDVFSNYSKESYFDPSRYMDTDKGIKAWLSGIARNHFRRKIEVAQRGARVSYIYTFPDRPFFDPYLAEDEEMVEPPPMIALKRALQTLSERDREILLIAFQFEEEGRLPKTMRQTLCEKYGLSPDSLRQIKKRAKEKIENYLQEHSYLTQPKSNRNV